MGPKKIERIKITRKKEHSPLIKSPPQEPDPLSPSPPQEPNLPSASEAPPQEPDPPTALAVSPQEQISMKDKLLTLLESKDEDYIIDFIYECMLKMKEREEEIEKTDPQMWALIQELKEMMDP